MAGLYQFLEAVINSEKYEKYFKGLDFRSWGVVKSDFREKPVIFGWKTFEFAGLKRVEIPEHPPGAEAHTKLRTTG